MILTVKLAKGHVKLVNVQLAVSVGVVVADHMAQLASRAQLLHIFLPGDLNFRNEHCRLSASARNRKVVLLPLKRRNKSHRERQSPSRSGKDTNDETSRKIHSMLNHLLELLPFQVTVVVSIVVRKHDADQVLFAVIIFGYQSGMAVQKQIILRQISTIFRLYLN